MQDCPNCEKLREQLLEAERAAWKARADALEQLLLLLVRSFVAPQQGQQ